MCLAPLVVVADGWLTATAGATVGANQAALLIHERLLSAVGARLALGLCAVGQIFLERALHTHLPGVDRLVVEFKAGHEFKHLLDGHAVAQHARDKFGIVPELGVELLREALDSGFEATLVDELEVVALHAILVDGLDNLALGHRLGAEDALVVVGNTGEDFIRTIVDESDEGNPLLLVVLEADHVGIKFDGAFEDVLHIGHVVTLFGFLLLLVVVRERNEHAGARAVAVDGAALAAAAPSRHVQFAHHLLANVVGQVDGDANRVVDPLLHSALHLHLLDPVDVVAGGLVVRRLLDDGVELLVGVVAATMALSCSLE